MSKCIVCKQNEGVMNFHVMEVRTTKTRDFAGRISKFQELYGMSDLSVCDYCIDQKLSEIKNPIKQFIPTFKYSILLFIIGIFMIVRPIGTPYTVLGSACILVCLFKVVDFIKKAETKRKNFEKFSVNNARFVSAWECISSNVQKRDSNYSISFIPVTKATFKMSAEDFVNYYGLTHENAGIFYKMLHSGEITIAEDPKYELSNQ